MIREPYRLGKFFIEGKFIYRLWFNHDLIHEGKTFEECNEAMKKHLDKQP